MLAVSSRASAGLGDRAVRGGAQDRHARQRRPGRPPRRPGRRRRRPAPPRPPAPARRTTRPSPPRPAAPTAAATAARPTPRRRCARRRRGRPRPAPRRCARAPSGPASPASRPRDQDSRTLLPPSWRSSFDRRAPARAPAGRGSCRSGCGARRRLSAVSSRPCTIALAPGIGTRPSASASSPPTVSTSSRSGRSTPNSSPRSSTASRAVTRARVVVEPLDRRPLDVVLVGDLADDLLEDVLDRDEPGGAAVLVDDDRDVRCARPASRAAVRRPAWTRARRLTVRITSSTGRACGRARGPGPGGPGP